MLIDIQPSKVRTRTLRVVLLVAALVLLWGVSHAPDLAFGFLLFIPIAMRDAMVRVWVDNDRLHVRNFWRNYDLARSEIESFGVDDSTEGPGARARTVFVRLAAGGKHRLSATRRSTRGAAEPGTVVTADVVCGELNAWLRDTSS